MSERPSPDARPTRAAWTTELTAFLLLVAILVLLVDNLPDEVFSPASESFILAIGVIGAWRYSWWFVQAIRSVWYNRRVFPRLRAAADAAGATEKPDALYILCTSYRIEPEVSFAVYDAMVREAVDYGVPTTIFAAVSDRSDTEVLDHVMAEHGQPANVEIAYMFQKGDGKRSAMAEVLRAISRRMPTRRSLAILMDGDVRVEPGTFRRTLPFFLARDDIGALTTNNSAIVDGDDLTKEWYDLRYAQRHLVMSSMALSERLLVLTGRYSVFRADLAVDPGFIDLVAEDHIDHWRFGRFKFLSGDDKSTWFWLLKNGWKMLYVPDVHVSGFEELPDRDRFFKSTLDLMRRWYGNMLRTSGRAIALGPRPMGLFTWWSLIDQRLSMWTTMIGPTVAIMLTLFVRPSFIFAYMLWILFTRSTATLILAAQRGRMSLLWVPLLYYNQICGAVLKTYVSFRFNRQKWSRQGISAGEPEDIRAARRQRRMGHFMHGVSVAGLVMVLAVATGVVRAPDDLSVKALTETLEDYGTRPAVAAGAGDSYWVARALIDAPSGGEVRLPATRVVLDAGLAEALAEAPQVRAAELAGSRAGGGERTRLIVAPDLAAAVTGPEGRTLADAGRLSCGATAATACRLDVGRTVRLTGLEAALPTPPAT